MCFPIFTLVDKKWRRRKLFLRSSSAVVVFRLPTLYTTSPPRARRRPSPRSDQIRARERVSERDGDSKARIGGGNRQQRGNGSNTSATTREREEKRFPVLPVYKEHLSASPLVVVFRVRCARARGKRMRSSPFAGEAAGEREGERSVAPLLSCTRVAAFARRTEALSVAPAPPPFSPFLLLPTTAPPPAAPFSPLSSRRVPYTSSPSSLRLPVSGRLLF